jgi:TRAP-type C4-dicarboxylate transport system substrate-binding protein
MSSSLFHSKVFRGSAAAVVAVGMFAVSGCAPSDTGPTDGDEVFTYRVATIEGVGTPMNDAFDTFISEVETCSDGRLVGTNFPAGQLGGYLDLIEGNRQGTYEITSGGMGNETDAPGLVATGLGYIFQDEEHVERVIDELGGEMSKLIGDAYGVTILGFGEDGWRWMFSNRPVESIDDLSGLKIRVPEEPIPLGVWSSLGASPTPVPFTEMYNALETGVINAGESSVAQISAGAFWEPAPHLVNTKHWYAIKPVRANSAWFDGLPAELQSCLTEVGKRVFTEARIANRALAEGMLADMVDGGAIVHEVPSDIEEWAERAAAYNETFFAEQPEAKDFIDKVMDLTD